MRRRRFLAAAGTAGTFGLAGCSGLFETTTQSTGRAPPLVENRPDAVYIPSHIEGMEMVGMGTSGPYRFSLSYSFPHRFWRTTGDRTNKVSINDDDTVHLMLTAWDDETKTVIPSSAASVSASKDGSGVLSNKKLWSMVSQNMGVHFGDNVELDGAGEYDVTASFGPLNTRLAGALADRTTDQQSVSIGMPFDQETLDSVMYKRLEDHKGKRDAIDPMSMEMRPSGQAPATDDLPGQLLAEGESGDAVLAVVALDSAPAGVDGEGTYLAVCPRTPYNRYPLPFMSLSATLSRAGDTVFRGDLTDTIHPELSYHYGAVVDGVESGDTLELTVDAPPQISRHEGYETAFISMDPVELTV